MLHVHDALLRLPAQNRWPVDQSVLRLEGVTDGVSQDASESASS
jgi:hypothetical protein